MYGIASSAQFANLRNFEIAKLQTNFEIVQPSLSNFETVFVMRTEAPFGFLGNQKRKWGWASDISYIRI